MNLRNLLPVLTYIAVYACSHLGKLQRLLLLL